MTITHPGFDKARSDREALSALFDGELGGDAARFALKRLDHDHDWRETCERWSLVGDVLRAQGQALLPAGFPARMRAAAGAREPLPAKATVKSPRWALIGGAGLAASVAAAALFFARQTAQVDAPATPAPIVADVQAPAKPATPPPAMPKPQGTDAAQLATAGVLVAEASRQGVQRTRAQQRPRTTRAAEAAAPKPVAPMSVQPPETAIAAAPLLPMHDASPVAPFTRDPTVARPWPRAVLPQLGGSGALTTDFGKPSPSFYPFEPRLPDDDDATDEPAQRAAPAN